jgi:hypothetical protein
MLAGVFYFKRHVFGVGSRCKDNELLSGGVELGEPVLLLCLLFLEFSGVFLGGFNLFHCVSLLGLNTIGAVPVQGWTVVVRVVAAKGAGGIVRSNFGASLGGKIIELCFLVQRNNLAHEFFWLELLMPI